MKIENLKMKGLYHLDGRLANLLMVYIGTAKGVSDDNFWFEVVHSYYNVLDTKEEKWVYLSRSDVIYWVREVETINNINDLYDY